MESVMAYGVFASKVVSLFLLGLAVGLVLWAFSPLKNATDASSTKMQASEFAEQDRKESREVNNEMSNISTWNIFGPMEISESHDIEDTPLATENYGLMGVVSNSASGSGWAILQKNSNYEVVASSKKIATGVVLKSVHENYAIVDDQGSLRKVQLPPFENMNLKTVKYQPADTSSASPPRPDDKDISEAGKVRARMIAAMNLKPIEEGTAKGYIIEKHNKELEDKFGLDEGDKILSASGYPLGTKADDLMAVEAFRASGSASILIEKSDGTQITIAYPP
tara:strand:- start:1785 stop:2624 length:840 start_codon:yes stop_codon:yes gene_type:complete